MKKLMTLLVIALMGFTATAQTQKAANSANSDENDCGIKKVVDKFKNETTYSTPSTGLQGGCEIIHIVGSNYKTDYLCLTLYDSYCAYGDGIIVLFTDGTTWKNNDDISPSVSSSTYRYMGFCSLNAEDLELFSTKTIAGFKLYIFEKTISETKGEKFKEYVNCIKNM